MIWSIALKLLKESWKLKREKPKNLRKRLIN
jgi:hypothetical protein